MLGVCVDIYFFPPLKILRCLMDFVHQQRPDYGTIFPPRWLCIPLLGVCVLLPVYVDLSCPATLPKLLREVQASNPYGTGQTFFMYYDL